MLAALTRNLTIMTMCLFGFPCTCLHMKAPVRISYVRTEACLLEGAGRDVSQADRGGGQAALKRRTPIVTIAERPETGGSVSHKLHSWT